MGDYTENQKYENIQVPEKLHRRIEGLASVLKMGTGVLTAEVMEAYLNKVQRGVAEMRNEDDRDVIKES